jgi:serine/threonine-protein kinase
VAVPQVVGLTEKSARGRLEKAGLKVTSSTETSDTVEKGRVIDSRPTEGDQVPVGSTVRLIVSSGVAQVAVPSVVGQQVDSATATLENAGFKVVPSQVESDKTPGTVLSQSPTAGSNEPKGATVTITVAKAPTQVTVPDIMGETQDVAVSRLSGAGFQVQIKTKTVNSPEGDGIVIAESPSGGTKAKKGSKVTITVGKYTGPPATTPTTPGAGATTTPTTTTTTPGATG